ncbi:MAG: hypothetical protein A2622_05120 [Bdellovibrionales bacterium RIFCSPHIGHO2_01_FULL_40_29]|nr:MAG: hypothetical protein A2622_05120 [Bdellovibrionales bacterium RIFCSPHIGHO2_01_FULL_40_29]OFZ34691.1 MAG: hypothetical protein A3D17_10250 [Bdellovibrionales bacterium RIFCSPHIGHO2_02_FULL_40_15]
MRQNLIFTCIMLLSTIVMAASGGESHGDDHIPFDKIGWQAANLGVLLIIIFFGIRKSIVEAFAKRQTDFLEQSEKTKVLLNQAEAELKEIKTKLATLEAGETKSFENAQHEANLIKANIIKDAEAQAEKLKADAALSIRNELAKAKSEINQIILTEAVFAAKEKLAATSGKAVEAQFLNQVDQAHASKATL